MSSATPVAPVVPLHEQPGIHGATCDLERMMARMSPATLTGLQDVLPDNKLVVDFPVGWDRLQTLIDPGVARDLTALASDPAPVAAALAKYPSTLLHGDLRIANVAWDGHRAIPVDWRPLVAPPRFECAHFVMRQVQPAAP